MAVAMLTLLRWHRNRCVKFHFSSLPFSFLTVISLPLPLLRAMRLLVNFPSHTLICDLISCFIYRVAELAALKTQLEVALERQIELEEENKVRCTCCLVLG